MADRIRGDDRLVEWISIPDIHQLVNLRFVRTICFYRGISHYKLKGHIGCKSKSGRYLKV
jgi:hypothetical protein